MRNKSTILLQFKMEESVFQALYDSYEISLTMHNINSSWNEGIDELAREISALTDKEIEVALTDLQRAILNRIIMNRCMMHPSDTTNPKYQPLKRTPLLSEHRTNQQEFMDNFSYRLYTTPIIDGAITYHSLFICHPPYGGKACYIISAESSANIEGAFLCAIDPTQRRNMGRSMQWLDSEIFLQKALQMAHEYFDVSP